MTKDTLMMLVYAFFVATVTLFYVGYEDLGLLGHAKATQASTQAEADDE
jgi:hypothetical protein